MSTQFKTGHIGLSVTDLDRSRGFYTRVFGFDVLAESEEENRKFCFLGYGDELVVTLWEQSDDRFTPHVSGLQHLSFEVPTMEDVKASREQLREEGVRFEHEDIVPHGEDAHSGGIFFMDPDGIRLEIYAPEGAQQEATAGASEAVDGPPCGFF